MEVPFLSSGALSRAHYSVVRSVEETRSTQVIQQRILEEIASVRHRLTSQALSKENVKESLVILLYCFVTLPSSENRNLVDFALPHAINLAEAGRDVQQKRIGYLFCAEIMPADHELQLMLVNTLRKDLEDERPSRICLALDNIINSSNEDLIPAIDSRLLDLLSHNSPHVRRRSIMAFRSLARHHSELLTRITRQIALRLDDTDSSVVNAALFASTYLSELPGVEIVQIKEKTNHLFRSSALRRASSNPTTDYQLLTLLSSLKNLGISEENVSVLWKLTKPRLPPAIRRGAFSLLRTISGESMLTLARSRHLPLAETIRPLLVSPEPNDVYLFLSCLDCLDPIVWAGSTSEFPPTLDGWEVERIMHLLESQDSSIRHLTLRILNRIDTEILSSYYTQNVGAVPHGLSIHPMNECAVRLLEILEARFAEDGESYGRGLTDMLTKLETCSDSKELILDRAVDRSISFIHESTTSFRIGCVTTLLAFVADAQMKLSQTSLIISAALTAEHSGQSAIPPVEILGGFTSRLSLCPPSVQDACILAMLRVVADCEEVPSTVLDSVEELKKHSGRHVRRRCEMFTTFTNQKDTLIQIVKTTRPKSLPEFLSALEAHTSHRSPSAKSTHLEERSPSRSHLASSQLRYKAYDRPAAAPKLRDRHSSNQSESSSQSGARPDSRASSVASSSMMRTLTPGELTLVAGTGELEHIDEGMSNLSVDPFAALEPSPSRADLIALDSPFTSEPDVPEAEYDVEQLWNGNEGGDSGGWQIRATSMDDVVRRMQQMGAVTLRVITSDVAPFKGDLKVVIISKEEGTTGVLRLREIDEDNCLWRLRSGDRALLDSLKQKLLTV